MTTSTSRILALAAFGGVSLFALNAAAGISPTAERAAEIEAAIEAAMARALIDVPDARLDADWTVEPSGDGYAVSVDGFDVTAEGESFSLPGLSFRMTQQTDDLFRVHDLVLPREFELPEGAGVMTFGAHSVDVVWSNKLQSLMEGTARIDDMVLEASDGSRFDFGDLDYVATATPKGDLFDQNVAMTLSGVSGMDPSGAEMFSLDAFKIDGGGTGFNLDAMQRINDMEREVAALEADGSFDPTKAQEVLDELAELVTDLADSFNVDMTLSGLTVNAPGAPPFALDETSFGFAMSKMRTDEAGARLTYGHKGLDLSIDPTADLVLPRATRIEMTLDRLPAHKMLAAALAELTGASPVPLEMAMMQMVSEAQTEFAIPVLAIDAQEVDVEGSGSMAFKAGAMMGAVGGADLTARGLDGLLQALSGVEPNEMVQQIQMGVMMAKGFGKPETANGETIYRYVLEVTEDGRATLNGAPLDQLMQ